MSCNLDMRISKNIINYQSLRIRRFTPNYYQFNKYQLNQSQNADQILRENKDLSNEIEIVKNDLKAQFVLSQGFRKENEFFENQNQELRKEIEQGGQYYNQLLEENDHYRTQLQQKNQQLEYLIQENNMCKDQMLSLQEENEQVSNELQNLQELVNSNEYQYQDSDQKKKIKKQNRKQIKELERLVIKREQEISQLYGAIEEMKAYVTSVKHQSDKYEQNLAQLLKDYQILEMERNKYAMKMDQMQNYNDRFSTLQQQIQTQEKAKVKEFSSLKNQNEQLQVQNLQYQEQIQNMNEEFEKITQQYIDLQELNEQYINEAQILKDTLIEKDQKLERMQLQFQQYQQKDQGVQQQIRELTQQNKEFSNAKLDFQKEMQSYSNQINQLKDQLQREQKEHQNQQDLYKREKQSLMDRLKVQDEKYSEMEAKQKQLEMYFKQAEEERLFRAQAEQYVYIYEIRSFEEVSQQCMQLQDQNRDLLRQVANLENDVQKNDEEIRQLKKNNKNSQNFDKTTQQLILKDREILHLQSVVERLEGMNRQLQQECDRLAAKIQLTSHENSLLSKTNREINQMGKLLLEGQQIKEMLEKKKYEKPLTMTNSKAPQVIQQLQQHSRRPSIKKS